MIHEMKEGISVPVPYHLKVGNMQIMFVFCFFGVYPFIIVSFCLVDDPQDGRDFSPTSSGRDMKKKFFCFYYCLSLSAV